MQLGFPTNYVNVGKRHEHISKSHFEGALTKRKCWDMDCADKAQELAICRRNKNLDMIVFSHGRIVPEPPKVISQTMNYPERENYAFQLFTVSCLVLQHEKKETGQWRCSTDWKMATVNSKY